MLRILWLLPLLGWLATLGQAPSLEVLYWPQPPDGQRAQQGHRCVHWFFDNADDKRDSLMAWLLRGHLRGELTLRNIPLDRSPRPAQPLPRQLDALIRALDPPRPWIDGQALSFEVASVTALAQRMGTLGFIARPLLHERWTRQDGKLHRELRGMMLEWQDPNQILPSYVWQIELPAGYRFEQMGAQYPFYEPCADYGEGLLQAHAQHRLSLTLRAWRADPDSTWTMVSLPNRREKGFNQDSLMQHWAYPPPRLAGTEGRKRIAFSFDRHSLASAHDSLFLFSARARRASLALLDDPLPDLVEGYLGGDLTGYEAEMGEEVPYAVADAYQDLLHWHHWRKLPQPEWPLSIATDRIDPDFMLRKALTSAVQIDGEAWYDGKRLRFEPMYLRLCWVPPDDPDGSSTWIDLPLAQLADWEVQGQPLRKWLARRRYAAYPVAVNDRGMMTMRQARLMGHLLETGQWEWLPPPDIGPNDYDPAPWQRYLDGLPEALQAVYWAE